MKLFFRLWKAWVPALLLALVLLPVHEAAAQVVGKAAGDFPNQRPGKGETTWGRLVADSVRATGGADIALINAGALRPGTLSSGPVEVADINALLAFGDDEVVTLSLSGAQLRAALERAASAYPTVSTGFLHVSGLTATFDPNAPPGRRVGNILVRGRAVGDQDTFAAAMPFSLSEGAAGYFNIWSGAQSKRAGVSLRDSISNFFRAKGEVSPDNNQRFGAA